ncbi:GNAT family N-acetyltransferase [Halorarum halophilum]|uniref:GNAT family N-acetyltransferase n=1 Tax=Halorarum halophilum TaxID=2743090 RepID=A0A7D5L2W7_9EURY|nr:GNAT family N-acetyltransferase [Halobaculum halophilum]QLG28663.1 GNAT family N-acetyltransferase [Halobaculum halophilum]
MNVREVETDAERAEVFPVLTELRSHLDREEFEALYEEMAAEGYRLFAGYDDDDPVAVAGVTVSTNFYLGKHAYVYDLVTTADRRSEGHGRRLLEFVHEWAADRGCQAVELESGLWREDAHRFYEELGYEKYCYSFKYDLQ